MRRSLGVLTAALFIAAASHAAVVPIADIKEIDRYGELVMFEEVVTVTGVVTVPSGAFSPADGKLDAYIQDKTSGINIYTSTALGIKLAVGDSVMVTGRVEFGYTSPIAGTARLLVRNAADLKVVGTGSVPIPLVLTAAELSQEAVPPLEPYEGLLVRVEGLSIISGEWPPSPGVERQPTVGDGTGSFKMRLDGDTDIGGSPEPSDPFILIGIVAQNSTYPYLSSYTVWPRSRYDGFLNMGNGSGTATVDPDIVENDVESVTLAVTLTGNGLDTVTAFSVDLPLDDGWGWAGGQESIELTGPGVSNATFEATSTGVIVTSCAIFDAGTSFGTVRLSNVWPPGDLVTSEIPVETSVDGETFEPIAEYPTVRTVYPIPPVYISEIYPDDGSASASCAFVELANSGTSEARLQGFVLCEVRAVASCDQRIKYTFGAGDVIPAGGYLVIAKSAAGFEAKFGFAPDLVADISPLGRQRGDGAICGSGQYYEAFSLWRDNTLRDRVDAVEYFDSLACKGGEVCTEFDDLKAFTLIPPAGYALAEFRSAIPEYPVGKALTANPTPGAANQPGYRVPVIKTVNSFSVDAVEVIFSEPLTLVEQDHFTVNNTRPLKMYTSVSREKVLLYLEDQVPGGDSLEVTGVRGLGAEIADTVVVFNMSNSVCSDGCEIQAYDSNGFSPLNGQNVCMIGFITVPPGVFQPDYSSLYVQALDGCGINVFSYDVPSPRPELGDLVSLSGDVTEYVGSSAGSTTEILMQPLPTLSILSKRYPEPDPLVLRTGDVSREEYEGRLVQTEGAVIDASEFDFFLDDGSGGIQVYQNFLPIDFTKYGVGMYIRVKGVVLQYDYTRPFLESYELVPRSEDDIEVLIENTFPDAARLDVDARVFCPSCGDEGFGIRFGGQALSDVILRLFDGAGREIRTLYSGKSVGEIEIQWDGRDDDGELVPPGVYVCYIEVTESGSGRTTSESSPIVVGIRLE